MNALPLDLPPNEQWEKKGYTLHVGLRMLSRKLFRCYPVLRKKYDVDEIYNQMYLLICKYPNHWIYALEIQALRVMLGDTNRGDKQKHFENKMYVVDHVQEEKDCWSSNKGHDVLKVNPDDPTILYDLERMVAELPNCQRKVFTMWLAMGAPKTVGSSHASTTHSPMTKIGETLGMTRQGASYHFVRARQTIQKKLKKAGYV